jgi:N-carbamoylputrescine amidase
MSLNKIKMAAASISNYIGDTDKSVEKMDLWSYKAKQENADLVLFPELSLSGYIPASISKDIAETVPGPSVDRMIGIAENHSIIIGFGIIEKDKDKI